MIRENTEGTYAGEGGFLRKDTPHEIATQGSVNTRTASSGASATRSNWPTVDPASHLTLVHKTNVLTFSGDLWERTFDEVAAGVSADVDTAYNHVDAACIYFVQDPQRYDVIVTDNLFGDILTDLGGAVSGGIGLASSANLNPERRPSMFEPVHGSAPDIAGKEHRQPDRGDPVGRADARSSGRGRRSRPHSGRLRLPCRSLGLDGRDRRGHRRRAHGRSLRWSTTSSRRSIGRRSEIPRGRPESRVFDTTLRDGVQFEGISVNVDDKLRVARKLDELGVHYIEGGYPAANPKDDEFFERARDRAATRVVPPGGLRLYPTAQGSGR